MLDMFTGLSPELGISLFLALVFVLAYEFINGFHDTANAVATVIYTKAMPPHLAVFFSGVLSAAFCLSFLPISYSLSSSLGGSSFLPNIRVRLSAK